jgi:Flp pilus assembly protein TadG
VTARTPRRDERGAVTAELAMAIPLLVAVTLGLVWLLSLGTAQVRMVDATREAARAIARGDSVEEAISRAQPVAPEGSTLSVSAEEGGQVVVTGTAEVDGVGGLFAFLPSVELSARAVAAAEEPP